jgi:hypothetical protein
MSAPGVMGGVTDFRALAEDGNTIRALLHQYDAVLQFVDCV